MAPDGSIIEVPSVSQRRLLGLLAVHAPRQLRVEWLADVLGDTSGALRTTVSRLRAAIGRAALRTTGTGYSLEGDVDAIRFCSAVGNADKASDKLGAFEQALTLWTGPALEEFQGEEWARGETARLTEIHAPPVWVLAIVEQLIRAHGATDGVAAAEGQIGEYRCRDRARGLLIRALALAGRQGRRPASVPDLPLTAGRGVRNRALTRGRPDRRSGGDWAGDGIDPGRPGARTNRGGGGPAAGEPGAPGGVRRPLRRAGGASD